MIATLQYIKNSSIPKKDTELFFQSLHLLLHLEQFPLQLLPQEHPPLFFIIYLTAKNSPIKTANKRIQSKNPIFHSPLLNQHQYLVDNK